MRLQRNGVLSRAFFLSSYFEKLTSQWTREIQHKIKRWTSSLRRQIVAAKRIFIVSECRKAAC